MNDSLRAIARAIPIPVDHTGPARAYATVDASGYRVYFLLEGYRQSEPVGPPFAKPGQAVDFAKVINGEAR